MTGRAEEPTLGPRQGMHTGTMLSHWRTALAVLCGVIGAVIWAAGLAIYQPYMEPVSPDLGDNNTYWPRDIRQLAILLALAGVVLVGHATMRSLLAAGGAAAGWLAADLILDRVDVHGRPAAGWLAAGAVFAFAATAAAARRVAADGPGQGLVRHVAATVAAVLAALTMLITTPWEEPVADPDHVRIEDTLSMLKAVLVVMFAAAAAGLVPPRHVRRVAAFAGLAALALWPAATMDNRAAAAGMLAGVVLAAVAVAAARDVSLPRLLGVAAACAVVLFPGFLLLYFIGSAAGGAMTALAGNPPVNGADSDLAFAFAALVLGLALAAISRRLTRPAPSELAERAAAAELDQVPAR